MKIAVSIILVSLAFLASPAYANSYLQMLTTPPENYPVDTSSENEDYFSDEAQTPNIKDNLWYDSRLITSAPIVVSSKPKYQAWLRSKTYPKRYELRTKEKLQNTLYIAEGLLLGAALYLLYKF